MKQYTGKQWLLISLASHYGMEKDVYDDRLQFGRELLEFIQPCNTFEELADAIEPWTMNADVPEEFVAAALAVWDTCQGRKSHYVLGLDACNSGAQISSCMGRCIEGMKNTGLINTGVRPDLYQKITDNVEGADFERGIVKKAAVPHLYGSKREPKNVFGEAMYPLFIDSCKKTMPFVEWAKEMLINSWNSKALSHDLIMPDAGEVHLKVITKTEYTGHFKNFSYTFYVDENKPMKFGGEGTTSLAAK